MKLKRVSACLTALACCGGILSTFPQLTDKTYAAEYVHNDFETDYEGWYGNNDSVVFEAVNGEGFNGSRGMKISGRTSPEDGLASSKGFYLVGGINYKYNVKVFSETDEVFHVSLLYKDLDTDKATVVELDSQKVKAGEWTEISANYKAPDNTYEYLITITNDSTNDFIIDDVSITANRPVTIKAAPAGKGLKDEFADYFRVGNIFNGNTIKNSAIQGIILKDHNAVECENETKPYATIVQNGSTDTNVKVTLNQCAAILDFCAKNGIAFRGHTFVWHSQTPEWFFKQNFSDNGGYVSSSVMDQRMESYIKNMFNAYATQYPSVNLYAYDVCNEVIYDGTAKNGGLRPTNGTNGQNGSSAWVRVYGNNSFVEKAFTYARRYAPPTCKLYYNDYNEFAGDKKDCIKNTILIPLHNKGLLDGMGMQSHIDCSTGQWDWGSTSSYLAAMDDYLSLGIDVQVTELDISRDGGKYTDQQQADKYKAIFQHCVDVNKSGKYKGKVTLVQVWGPNDDNSWVGKNNAGQPNYPLLYNGNNQPKTAYNSITSIIPDNEWGDGSKYDGGNVTLIEPNEYGWYFQHGFEGDLHNWEGRGGATVLTSGRTAYVGNEALLVQERTSAWHGAQLSLSPNPFKPGEEFSFSVNVTYFDGPETTDFKFTLQYTGSDGEPHYSEIASATGVKGKWVQLANTNYKIPEDATDMKIYVETSDETTNNFYIDEVIGAVAGTGIQGAGQPELPKPVVPGDVNSDGVIDVFDLIMAKQAIVSKVFSDENAEKAADADQSGKFEINDAVLIQEYVTGKIKEFPVAEKVVDVGAMENIFKSISVTSSYKKNNENNPLTTQRFGADPGWMVYDGRLYLYTTNDAFEYNSDGKMRENTYDSGTINCISSADLVNWTDHGAIPVAGQHKSTTNPTNNGVAKWANRAWAPDACWKKINGKDKFFLYFANSGGGIGVLTADSPTGPWTDPIGKPLLDWNTPGNSGVVWMFDPGVYYDETTGKGYIAFGGGVDGKDKANPKTGRIAELGDDMISIKGSTKTMETPYLFEDSSLIKIGDTWYYSYCTNWNVPYGTNINGTSFGSGEICYMTSKDPMGYGQWTSSSLKGKVLPGTGVVDKGGNNHHSIIYFKNKYYVAYHTRAQAISMTKENGYKFYNSKGELTTSQDGNYRSTHLDEATFDASTGKISCNITMGGVKQIESLNPYVQNRAATMSNQSKDIVVKGVGNTTVAVKKGSFTKVSGVNFSKGADKITVRASSTNGGVIKICTGSTSGDAIAYVEIPAGSMSEVTVPTVASVSGSKDLYFVYSGDMELDWWQFA